MIVLVILSALFISFFSGEANSNKPQFEEITVVTSPTPTIKPTISTLPSPTIKPQFKEMVWTKQAEIIPNSFAPTATPVPNFIAEEVVVGDDDDVVIVGDNQRIEWPQKKCKSKKRCYPHNID
jgi:hypothetical protein